MRDEYRLKGPTAKLQVELEKEVCEQLEAMSKHSKMTTSELTNTALKRFISSHKDFMPPQPAKG